MSVGEVVVDLFAGGARGWDIHDEQMGLNTIGVEENKIACATARAAGMATVQGDVRRLSPVGAGFTGGKFSPPCQTFSGAGKGAGRLAVDAVYGAMSRLHKTGRIDYDVFSDIRTGLVLEPLRWALDLVRSRQPFRWLVMEQVPPVLPIWEQMGKVLESVGYSVATGNLYAEQYGVPQTRKRAVLIARLDGEARMPIPTHSKYYPRSPAKLDIGVKKWVSMAEALKWIEPAIMRSNYGTGGDPAARGERTTEQPAPTVTGKIDRNKWVYERPATTVQGDSRLASPGHRCMTANCHEDREPESMMANAVRVTVQEAAILQSLPADHPWRGTKTQQYLQVGNAIPALLAKAILETVIR